MSSYSGLAVSCFGRLEVGRFAEAKCPECERLEAEFLEARDRLHVLTRLRRLTPFEEKRLIERVAMAIARIKEHERKHGARYNCERCEKKLAQG
jgi:uncharacterized OB-fold protein